MLKKIGLIALACVVLIGAASYGAYKFFYPGDRTVQKKPAEEEKFVAAGRTNIAILGVDKRDDDDGRSDTIFVIMYEPKTKNVAMLSVPRDTRVRISENYWDKINHSYAYGGAKRVVSTLENFLGLQIDHYIELDFNGFVRMVDAIDGVELDVEERMYYFDPYDGPDGFAIDLQPGMQKLDGKKAIQYVRYRDEDGDIGRVKRQQNFINNVYDKMLSPEMLKTLPELSTVAYSSVETDMSIAQILNLGRTLHANSRTGIRSFSVPGTPADFDEINYWLPDVMAVREEVAEVLGLSPRERERFLVSASRVAQSYEDSLPVYVPAAVDEDEEDTEDTVDKDKDKTDKENKSSETKDQLKDKPAGDKTGQEKNNDNNDEEKKPSNEAKAPKQLRASVINCSGEQTGGRKMESLLESNGIRVVSIFEGNEQSSSSIVSNTQDGWAVSKLAALPFRYSLRINKADSGSSIEAVVYVGKDFVQN